MKHIAHRWFFLISLLLIVLTYQNCDQISSLEGVKGINENADQNLIGPDDSNQLMGTSGGNPSGDNAIARLRMAPFQDNGTEVTLCFEGLKIWNNTNDKNPKYKMAAGEVKLDPSGTDLGNYVVPMGIYNRMEMTMKDKEICPSGNSVQVKNKYGIFATQKKIEINIKGDFEVFQDGNIDIFVQEFIDLLSEVQSSDDIKTKLKTFEINLN